MDRVKEPTSLRMDEFQKKICDSARTLLIGYGVTLENSLLTISKVAEGTGFAPFNAFNAVLAEYVEELREGIQEAVKLWYPEPEKQADGGQIDQTNDPWAHRSEKMVCGTCTWFTEKKVYAGLAGTEGVSLGLCRAEAPSAHGWPETLAYGCGQHKLDEAKA